MTSSTATSARRTLLIAFIVGFITIVTGCGSSSEQPTTEPTSFATTPEDGVMAGEATSPGETTASQKPIAVVAVDSSGSVQGTDLLDAAENRVRELVNRMPVGGKVVVYSLNSNVTAMCNALVIELPSQPNPDLEKQARQAAVQVVSQSFQRYIDCSTRQDLGGTELWGGLTEIFSYYPTAQVAEIFSDGCDNATTPGICNAENLRDPDYPDKALASIPPALTPALNPNVRLTFHGVGRNTALPADAVVVLRKIIAAWAQKTTAQTYFAAS